MIVFYADLDNTLLYSYRHDIGHDKVGVETYQGRTISFMTSYAYELLNRLREQVMFIPVTTRTREQYERIRLGSSPPYALVCNGGVLLDHGQEDTAWYENSVKLTTGARDALCRGREYMERDPHRIFEVRCVRELFLFTKSAEPREMVKNLRDRLDGGSVDIFQNGEKVYIVPVQLNKGMACRRVRERLGMKKIYTVAAGDSGFDVPMLRAADLFLAPAALCDAYDLQGGEIWSGEEGIFSDFILRHLSGYLSALSDGERESGLFSASRSSSIRSSSPGWSK